VSKYAELDGKILVLLADGPMNWKDIHAAISGGWGTWMVTDRRLQSLRRAGLIAPDRKNGRPVWRLK
jgi:hypothetical protein